MSTEGVSSPECLTHLIPGNKSQGNLSFAWGNGNQLALFHLHPPSNNQCPSSANKSSNLLEVKWDVSLHSPIARRLINESHGIFMSLQKLEGDISSIRPQLVKVSHNYRSVIKLCIDNFRSAAGTCSPEMWTELNAQCQIFNKIELVWNLCEILFINIQPGGVIMCQLLDWIQWHCTEYRDHLQDILDSPCPDSHKQYWNTLYAYVLQGKMNEARKLLKLNSDIHTDHFQSMDELLRKMPLYSSYVGHSLTEFNLRWYQWQEECSRRLEDNEFSMNENLNTLAKILCGKKEVFHKLSSIMGTWYHLLVSLLLYTNPSFKGLELHQLAEECIDAYDDGLHNMSHLDNILLAAIDFDLQQVIKGCYGCLDQWFVAHLMDLLFHCGETQSDKLSHGPLLREALLLDYATSLMSHHSLWEIGVDYFDHCPISGKYHMELHLERIPLTSYHKALKVHSIAAERDMTNLVFSICKVMGRQALEQKRLGSAVAWAIKSKDAGFASYLADKILSEYAMNGQFTSLDVLDNLGSCMLVSDRLTFLGKYREFHKLYEDKNFQAAADLMVSLLTSQIVPKDFSFTLLVDALPLLESEEPIFNSSQTQELMYCLQELTSSWKSSKIKVDLKLLKDKEKLIRIALARNLARTFVQEGTQFH